MRSLKLIAVALALVASACGGGGETGSGQDPESTTTVAVQDDDVTTAPDEGFFHPRVLDATDALVARLGVEDAGVALVWALNRGYATLQIFDAAEAGTLAADGTISAVDPELGSYDLIEVALPSEGSKVVLAALTLANAADEAPITAEAIKKKVKSDINGLFDMAVRQGQRERDKKAAEQHARQVEDGRDVMIALFHLMAMGYSFDQILDGILFGEMTFLRLDPTRQGADPNEISCIGLTEFGADGSLLVVAPANSLSGLTTASCGGLRKKIAEGDHSSIQAMGKDYTISKVDGITGATTTSPTDPEELPLPWTYEGTVRREQTYTATFGAQGSHTAVNYDHVLVTLMPNGDVEGTYTRGGNGSVFECQIPEKAGQIYEYKATGEPEVDEITSWSHGDGVLVRPSNPSMDTYDFTSTYDYEVLNLAWSYSSSITIRGCFEGTFTLEEIWVAAYVPRTLPAADE